MRKSWWVLVLGSLVSFSSLAIEQSTLLECYKTNETHVEVTACLDNYFKMAESKLGHVQAQLTQKMSELDQVTTHGHAAVSASNAFEGFSHWRDKQCRLVEATFASGSGSGQAYLNCMIDVTNEQISRLKHLMGSKE